MTNEFDASMAPYLEAVSGRKAEAIVALDVRKLTSYADAFIICSGRSTRQVSAIAEHIKLELKKKNLRPLSIDGLKEGKWVLLDYSDVIIHVFYEETRHFYDLEGLWADARKINTTIEKNGKE